jgi:prolyl 4-hydroxylase
MHIQTKRILLIALFVIIIVSVLWMTCVQWNKKEGMKSQGPFDPTILEPANDSHDFKVLEIEDFLSAEECQQLIDLASKDLQPSRVYNESEDKPDDQYRISEQAWMKPHSNPIVKKIDDFAVQTTGRPIQNFEELQVVRYQSGGFFSKHYDACDGDKEFCQRMDAKGGPRLWSFLIYLNDDFKGGETVFPYINKTVVPKRGKLIAFRNSHDDESLIRDSFHGGETVTSGNKWICNKWIRFREYM